MRPGVYMGVDVSVALALVGMGVILCQDKTTQTTHVGPLEEAY